MIEEEGKMPIDIGIWRLDKKVERVKEAKMPSEDKLENILSDDISMLDPNLYASG